MRYADGELPWVRRILLRGALWLSPRLRQRVHEWRRFSNTVVEHSGGAREILARPGPRLVTELDEGRARSGFVGSEAAERAERMRSVEFLAVLALVLSLLVSLGSLALGPDGWGPAFHRLWGASTVVVGIGFVVFGRSQDRLVEQMGVRGQAETPVSSQFECFGVGFAVSGAAYGLTGEVSVFITCILISGIVFEFVPRPRSDRGGPKPRL